MLRNSKLKYRKIIQCLSIDIPANKATLLLDKNRNTINRWYGIFRQVIYRHQPPIKDKLLGRVEVDESSIFARNGIVVIMANSSADGAH